MENSSLLQKSISKKNDLCQEEENKLCAIAKTTFINEKGRFRQKRKRKSLATRIYRNIFSVKGKAKLFDKD